MKTAVIEAGLAQMVAIGVGAGVKKLMGMALSPWKWLGIVVVVPLLSLLYSGRGSPSLNTSVSGRSSTLHSLELSSRLLFTSSSLPRTTAQEYRSFWCLLCTANVSLGGHFAIKVPFIPRCDSPPKDVT